MRILAVSYLFPNNVNPNHGIFVFNRLKAVRSYCELIVINPIPWFPFSSRFSRYKHFNTIPLKENIGGIDVYHPRFFIIPRYFKLIDSMTFCLSVLFVALKLKKHFKCDVVDLHWTYPDILSGYVLSRLFNRKLLVTVRGREALNQFIDDKKNQYVEEKSLRTILIKKMLPLADAVITLSQELKNITVNYGVSSNKITVIRNGVDVDKFYYIDQKKSRSLLKLPYDELILLAVGSLIYGKGFDRIIRHFTKIREKFPQIKLYIIGSEGPAGDYSSQLRVLVYQNKLEGSVKFIGQIMNNTLIHWYNSADLFCLVSRSEGSPNVLTEAIACGCPALATNVGAVSGILSNRELGYVIPNEDSCVGDGIIEALSRSYNRKKISEYMRQFNWDWCAKKVINEYNNTLGY